MSSERFEIIKLAVVKFDLETDYVDGSSHFLFTSQEHLCGVQRCLLSLAR